MVVVPRHDGVYDDFKQRSPSPCRRWCTCCQLEADLQNQLLEARSEAAQIVNEAEKDSEKLYKEAIELANSEANTSKENARLEIENQTSSAREQLSQQADALSELIVNRLIHQT